MSKEMTMRMGLTGLVAAAMANGAAAAQDLTLRLPLACEIGRTCFIQHHVDRDPGPQAKDFACGTVTYDAHDGTDFRVPTLNAQRAGIDVVAAADGRVLRGRDGVPDVSVRTRGREAIANAECGNGLVIAHAGGWETQYCHMAQGSLAVRTGDTVKAGQRLGRVGLSGLTEFPHLHFTVRRDGRIVDPFAPEAAGGACGGGTPLWAEELRPALGYRNGTVLNAGFAPGPVTMEAIESGEADAPVFPYAPALVAFVRVIGLKAGDRQRLVVLAPDGRILADNAAPPLDANKAQFMLFTGARRPTSGWEPGAYRARYTVMREDEMVIDRAFTLDLNLRPIDPKP